MAAGDSYGASLAASSSSGANNSGAVSLRGGGNLASSGIFGPGSNVLGYGSGASAILSWLPVVLVGGLAAWGVWLIVKKLRAK